eukprot:scaffold11543_cov128-Isochrysis_galbana.AAC.4
MGMGKTPRESAKVTEAARSLPKAMTAHPSQKPNKKGSARSRGVDKPPNKIHDIRKAVATVSTSHLCVRTRCSKSGGEAGGVGDDGGGREGRGGGGEGGGDDGRGGDGGGGGGDGGGRGGGGGDGGGEAGGGGGDGGGEGGSGEGGGGDASHMKGPWINASACNVSTKSDIM